MRGKHPINEDEGTKRLPSSIVKMKIMIIEFYFLTNFKLPKLLLAETSTNSAK